MKSLDQYVADVLAGRIVTGELVRLACERHRDDRKDKRFVWNEEKAQHACQHFHTLRHYKGKWAGEHFELAPWQIFIVGSLFGWYRPDGTRRYREAYIEIARKNGKTLLAAGIGAYLFLRDGEAGSEVYCVATKEEQAKLVWRDARFMIEAAPYLNRNTKAKHNTLETRDGKCLFRPLGRDSKTQDGLNPHGAIGDEMHAWPDSGMYDVIRSAFGARSQPMFVNITTAGPRRECFCFDHRQHCVNVLKGRKAGYDDDTIFAFIAALDDDDDPFDEANWVKANPNLDVSVGREYLRDCAKRAKLKPSEKNNFLTKNLNVWVDSSSTWLHMDRWDACLTSTNWDGKAGFRCYGGLDLASSTDFAAFALLFPEGNGYSVKLRLWLPEETLSDNNKLRDRRALELIRKWRDDGWVSTTPGDWIDYEVIQRDILEDASRFSIAEIGFDPHNAGNLPQKLVENNVPCVGITQGHRTLGAPTKEFERMILSREIHHDGNPVLRWMLGNVVLIQDMYGNNRPDKRKSHEKIDGVVACLMALQRAMEGSPQQAPSISVI